jgi:hypothetical protein
MSDDTLEPTPLAVPDIAPASSPSAASALPSRPVLGPVLRVYGALLWSYVIAGQFTTSWFDGTPIGEAWAALIVVGTTLLVLFSSMRRSAEISRALGVLALALLAFIVTLVVVVIAGATLLPGKHDFLYAFALVLTALIASLAGLRMTRPDSVYLHSARVRNVLTWLVLVVITLIAGAELVTSG